MQSRAQLLEQAIQEAGAAGTDPTRWVACIAAIAAAADAPGAALFHPSPAPAGGPLASVGTFSGLERAYFDHWIHRDPWNLAARGTTLFQRAGEIRLGTDFLSDDAFRLTDYYNEHARRSDSGHKLFLKVCDKGEPVAPETNLTLSRAFSQAPFGQPEKTIVSRLWPHLQRALRLQVHFGNTALIRQVSEDSVAALQVPCLILRADGRVEYASPAAEGLLRTTAWLSVLNGRLKRVGNLDDAQLCRVLTQAAEGRTAEATFAFRGTDQHLCAASLLAAPLANSALFNIAWPHAHVLVTLKIPVHLGRRDWSFDITALSRQQQTVLSQLADGRNIPEIATALGISPATVKKHLANISARTGCSSQVDLVRMALTGVVPNLHGDATANRGRTSAA